MMNSNLRLKKHLFLFAFIVAFLGTNLQLVAQTTLAEWTFNTAYDQAGTSPYNYTPNATARVAADGLDITTALGSIIYPNSAYGTLTDYEMSITPNASGQIKNVYQATTTYHNSARMQGAVAPADFTNPANHANYFQFSFPTTGFDDIKLYLSTTTQNVTTDNLFIYYSVDGGTSWASAGKAVGNCCWWTLSTSQFNIVAKNKTNVLVRLIGVQEGGTTGNYFYIDNLKITGNSTTIPTNTVSTINWAFNLGTVGQTATYTDASFYKPDNVTKGSNYSYLGTKTGSNPTVTYTSFKNLLAGNSPSGANVDNLIGFEFTPLTGLDFVPTNISFDCQRFGTGSGLIDVYWKSSNGTSTLIAANIKPARDADAISEAADTNTFNMNVTGLSIPALGGKSTLEIYIHSLGGGKDVGIANVNVNGFLNGTIADVAQYTVTTAVSPSGAGVVVSNNPATVDEGTVVSLTANANFGYQFAEWQDGLGTTVSTANPYQITVTNNVSYTAVFTQLTTYALDVVVEGGANPYMVTISPPGTMVSGSRMYVAGTNVTLTSSSNPILNFANWGTGETNNELIVTMDSNKSITAAYNAADYIVGWDFYDDVVTVDFSSNVVNDAAGLVLRNAAGATAGGLNFSYVSRVNSGGPWYGKYCRINWSQLADKFYYQIKINAADFTDISVQASMLTSYSGYAIQKCEYSLDGTNFTEVGTYNTSTINTWVDGTFSLLADANNQADVYIRWIPDYTSTAVVNGNDGTSISAIYVYGTPSVFNDGLAPVLSSSVPANNASGASATGKVVLNFDERIKITGGTTATLDGKNLTPVVFGKSISFDYSGLAYNTTYTFNLAGNVVSDLADNTLTDAISISFTTLDKPVVTKRDYDFIVGVDGNFAAALAAADAAKNSGNRFYIFFPNGNYDLGKTTGDATEQTFINLPNVSFIGQSADGVVLFNEPLAANEGIGTTPTINFQSNAKNIYMQDLTILNKMDYRKGAFTGRAVALRDQGDKNIYKNVKLLSNQDTFYTGSNRIYLENSEIHGTVDFIFGGGDVFFNACDIYLEDRNGNHVTAAATASNWGYVFRDCTIDGFASTNGNYKLGRPWQASPKVVYINTIMKVIPANDGWTEWGAAPSVYAEYNSLTSSGIAVDLSGRRTTFNYTNNGGGTVVINPVLTAGQADTYTIENVLSGTDTWQPTLLTEQASIPALSKSASTLNWDNDNYTLGWAVFKDNVFQDFVTTNSYTIPGGTSIGIYTIRAANVMGGLGASSNQVDISLNVKNSNLLGVKVYPNPVLNDEVFVSIPTLSANTTMILFGIDGRQIMKGTITASKTKLNLAGIPAGIYLLKVDSEKGTQVSKIIKK